MKRKDKTIRMWLTTWRKIRRSMPGVRGESVAEYFDRIERRLKEEDGGN